MTVLLASPGKLRQRARSVSPTGDIASTMCRLSRQRCLNAAQHASLVSTASRGEAWATQCANAIIFPAVFIGMS